MQYMTSIQIQTPTFVLCNNCELWFPVESLHFCTKERRIDVISHNYNINWNLV